MVDMLFLTDRKSMNFIVNYNMLKSPTAYMSEQRKEKLTHLPNDVKTLSMLK